jgi:hypothetical protein
MLGLGLGLGFFGHGRWAMEKLRLEDYQANGIRYRLDEYRL